jgi:hypothetical protein
MLEFTGNMHDCSKSKSEAPVKVFDDNNLKDVVNSQSVAFIEDWAVARNYLKIW